MQMRESGGSSSGVVQVNGASDAGNEGMDGMKEQ